MAKDKLEKIFIYFGCIIAIILCLFPFIWIFLNSIKSPKDIGAAIPKFIFDPTFHNYQDIFTAAGSQTSFFKYFKNSLIITIFGTVLSFMVSIPCGYALARFKLHSEKVKGNIAFALLSFWFGPELAVLIPLYTMYRFFGLTDTYIGLIMVYQVIGIPLGVWISRSFFDEIPSQLAEAASIDGYKIWHIFWKIDIPLVKPGLAAIAVLIFVFQWNNFVFALVIAGERTMPVTLGILGFIGYSSVLWGQMSAAIIISIIPAIILAILTQKYLVKGLTFGAVRG
jgi:multiple sugar transport system permease protein